MILISIIQRNILLLFYPDIALVVIVALLVSIIATMLLFSRITKLWLLLVPYALWVSYATALNASIVRMNPWCIVVEPVCLSCGYVSNVNDAFIHGFLLHIVVLAREHVQANVWRQQIKLTDTPIHEHMRVHERDPVIHTDAIVQFGAGKTEFAPPAMRRQTQLNSRNSQCEEKVGTLDVEFALVISPLIYGINHLIKGWPHVDGPSMACLLQPVSPMLYRPVIIACAFDEREA